MKNAVVSMFAMLALAGIGVLPAHAKVSAEEAGVIAAEAYVYFYPIVTMDVTRRYSTNVVKPEGVRAPMNAFANVPTYPTADVKLVVRPNFDTLYSSGWVSLEDGPVVVSAPDTDGRYYLLPMLDMWSDVFASPGWRTTGTESANYFVTPPGWTGAVPAGMEQVKAPTPIIWIIGRTKTDGPDDYKAVHKIQAGFRITPLAQWGKAPQPVVGAVDPSVDMKTAPKVQVDTMPGDRYFARALQLLAEHGPHDTDQPVLARMKRIGLDAGKPFDFSKLDPAVKKALLAAPAAGQLAMKQKTPTLARVANGWVMNTDTMGVYGTYYLKRAIVAQIGLGANLPEDAIYPLNLGDEHGKPLHGTSTYVLHFDKDDLPPVDAFWSVTLYDTQGYQVANSLDRFAVSSWMPFDYNKDGSLDLYIQNASPGKDRESNWLPAPQGGFSLTMRLYAPKAVALTGRWNPPPVLNTDVKADAMPQ